MATAATNSQQRAKQEFFKGAARAIAKFVAVEYQDGTLKQTLEQIRAQKKITFSRDWTYAELLEWSAKKHMYRPFLEYENQRFSFNDMNRRANRVARRLRELGVRENVGVAIMMGNHPRFIDTFFAIQKLGAYAVPVNAALIGDGLAYILEHSEVSFAIGDHESASKLAEVLPRLPKIQHTFVSTAEAASGFALPQNMRDFDALERGVIGDGENLGHHPTLTAPSLLMYTSGTTGLPKAVVTPYWSQRVKGIGIMSAMQLLPTDKLYTCLPLFHANALMLSVMPALWMGLGLSLRKRFSASRFWQEVSECGATHFNTVGSMIPILLKTPPSPFDRNHKVRRIMSAACPKDAWKAFEQRFGVEIWEGYGAVDGAGVTIVNAGNAPVGSIGKPAAGVKWKLVDADGKDAAQGQPGELCVHLGEGYGARVSYWKNEKASNEKVIDGWLHTGDSMYADAEGFLFFVGRNTDSMRRRGENVSAYEVEKIVDAHPDVLESAAFGVPSPVGEQDIMIAVVAAEGRTVDPAELRRYLEQKLPKYAWPSYLEVVTELPKTGTHRVQKNELKKRGVTPSAINLDALAS